MSKWVVTFHFKRGKSTILTFEEKQEALECIRVTVFTNEDCINFSCYRVDK